MSRVVCVAVGLPREVAHRGRPVRTGIFKEPVSGPVEVRRGGLAGDGQADLENHGGEDKAVYLYPFEHYAPWREELGRPDLAPGQLGENLTVEGFPEDRVHIGDALRVGSALVEVTQPRVPCFKLGIRMESPAFPKRFLASERSGFYARVLEEGRVAAGDAVSRERVDPAGLSVRAALRLLFGERDDLDGARRALRIPALSAAWRQEFEGLLSKADGGVA